MGIYDRAPLLNRRIIHSYSSAVTELREITQNQQFGKRRKNEKDIAINIVFSPVLCSACRSG